MTLGGNNGRLVAPNSVCSDEVYSNVKNLNRCRVTITNQFISNIFSLFRLIQVVSSDWPLLLTDSFDDGFFGGFFRQRVRLDMETSGYDSTTFQSSRVMIENPSCSSLVYVCLPVFLHSSSLNVI